jgi:hypothetical protein
VPLVHRRSFLVGLGSLMAAPAIVHASNLMPVKSFKMGWEYVIEGVNQFGEAITERIVLPFSPTRSIESIIYASEHTKVFRAYKGYNTYNGNRVFPTFPHEISHTIISHAIISQHNRPRMTVEELESNGISLKTGRNITIVA